MKLHSPFEISARLSPAVRIGKAFLSYDLNLRKFVLDLPDGSEHVINDFRPGAASDLQNQFGAILSFLSACAESRKYGMRNYGDAMQGENSDLFPENVGNWAESEDDAIQILAYEIEECGKDLIEIE